MARNSSGGYGSNYGPNPTNGYGSNNRSRPKKKHSGARMGQGKNGFLYVRGWNYSKRNGLVTFIGSQRKGGQSRTGTMLKNVCVNSKGEELLIFVVTVRMGMQPPYTVTGFWNENDRKLRIPEIGIVISPTAPNGGYCGRMNVKR